MVSNPVAQRSQTRLSTFDRVGVVFVAFLGTCLEWMIATTSDITFTPSLFLVFPYPGLAIGVAVSRFGGPHTFVIVSAVANGAIYGLLLYAWDRLANKLSRRVSRS